MLTGVNSIFSLIHSLTPNYGKIINKTYILEQFRHNCQVKLLVFIYHIWIMDHIVFVKMYLELKRI